MMWGKGGFFNWALGGKIPVLDFAGGTVVHISSGVSALVCALMLGKRDGYPHEPMMPHNVVLSLIGTGLLWVGWFGFNAGSALERRRAGHQRVCRHAFFGGRRRVELGGDGMVAQRQAQRARRGVRHGRRAWPPSRPRRDSSRMPAAFCIGLVAGVVCYFAVTKLKALFAYDDSLDVFGVHGIGSMAGMLMLGFLASAAVNPAIATTFQANGVAVSLAGGIASVCQPGHRRASSRWCLPAIATFDPVQNGGRSWSACAWIMEDESAGLDLTQHGERAYNE